ncbi:monovalent cation/H(+) antiporter subunit G [Mesorhizobium sp. BR1-1-16]|uniref:cation:proton antiporter n=1 Tax=Mesorhizobium sp. BR1-1-16 TaxID=2876653 RepID=UPI001CCD2770|nr:monovalent cation/H(+) antiporter subunit G [Mesorhizobium sp. BR1-1-16]MBZ9935529.1 monovalent cation/H(+) antiporter subunit G [Mesorhizobium sp. BR1-1-16]
MTALVALFSTAAIGAGIIFFLAGTVGLIRFPDGLTRLHALTKADNLGLGLIVIGLLPLSSSVGMALKLVVIWALVQFAGATVAQLIARVARSTERGE